MFWGLGEYGSEDNDLVKAVVQESAEDECADGRNDHFDVNQNNKFVRVVRDGFDKLRRG
jgi:hypothetical protein